MKGEDVRKEWLETDETAMMEPIVVEAPDGLGMKMPPEGFTVDDVAELVGEETPVEVIGMLIYLDRPCLPLLTLHDRRCHPINFAWLDTWQMGRVLQPRTLCTRENPECNIIGGFRDEVGGQDSAATVGPRDGLGRKILAQH